MADKIKSLDAEHQGNNENIEDLESQIAEPKYKLELMTGTFIGDMSRLDELAKSIELKSKEVRALEAQLPKEMPQKSLTNAKAELKNLSVDVKAKNELMNQLNKKINEYQSRSNSLQVELNRMISQKVQHQEKLQGLDQMKSQVERLEQEKTGIENKIKADEGKLNPLKEKLEALINQKEKTKTESKKQSERLQEEINKFKASHGDIQRLIASIEGLEELDLENKIKAAQHNITQWTKRIEGLRKYRHETSKEIQALNDKVINHEGNLRNLQDNMELRKIEMEKEEAKQKLNEANKQIGDLNPRES